MLPRPYKTCETNGNDKKIINGPWFKNLRFDTNIYCHLHLQQIFITSLKKGNKNKILEKQSIIR